MSNVNPTGSQGFEALLSCCLRSIIKVCVFVEHILEIILVSKMTNAGINHMGAFFGGVKIMFFFKYMYLSSKYMYRNYS